ncbi:hypothetical protein [Govanella unica]|uniref:Phosphatidate cytidylyltransferase n=1 Tax=Govanella unica TaxID=2975056 RepID=A0A9X3TXR5_9PROT|nr:hypothetical protein [Govania unica]MDA5193649.1 hypothetical protein [Govania unica]
MTVLTTQTEQRARLFDVIRKELATPVDPRVGAAVEDLAKRLGDAVVGVMFYGSCLRTGDLSEKILDFYVIVESYEALWPRRRFLRLANRLLPPNVFYAECVVGGETLRSKYAVLSLADFERLCGPDTFNSSVWARFAQPVRMVWARDKATEVRLARAVTDAVLTTIGETLPLKRATFGPGELWPRAFTETYAVELRSEKQDKGQEIVALYQERYDALTPIVLACFGSRAVDGGRYSRPENLPSLDKITSRWSLRRRQGKILSVLRLIKAASTFEGGLDYLAWKISRHSGVPLVVTPWQRRHPVLAGLTMFWRLHRKGAFR